MEDQYPDEEEGENKRCSAAAGGVALVGGVGRFYGWPSSRIIRVSRASGGKDRHSKVLTSKGLRDRRMRLSVNTAIQFYDLQDRLGYDQPSKAVEWLLNAAAPSIAELPPMNTSFPDTPKQLRDEKRSTTAGLADVDMDDYCGGDPCQHSQPQATKSETSNSENSKGSGLSLSRSESRMKARERARERVAEKEKEKEDESSDLGSLNPISHATSFTELLSSGINHGCTTAGSPAGSVHQNPNNDRCMASESNLLPKSPRQWSGSSSPMDYFTTGLLGLPASSGQIHLSSPMFPELQHFSFVSDNLVHAVNGAAGNSGGNNIGQSSNSDYNLNFTISPSVNSSGIAGFNRGTLQSNSSSPSLFPHLQRFPDGSPPGFFIGAATPVENYHQFLSGYDARLQHCYYADAHLNNNGKHSSQKGKAKS